MTESRWDRIRICMENSGQLSVVSRQPSVPPARATALALAGLCVLVLGIILWAGLSPFHAPKNEVRWLASRNGVAFGHHGTVLNTGDIQPVQSGSLSVEIWLKSARGWDSGTILALYSPREPYQFLLHQSISDLMIRTRAIDSGHVTRLYVDDVFGRAPAVFLTVTADTRGINVYENGELSKTFPGSYAAADLRPFRVVLGTAPMDINSWRGQIYGLALYNTKLDAARVADHFQSWKQNGRPAVAGEDKALAVYCFSEHASNIVQNAIAQGVNLIIPERFTTVDQVFLKPPWIEYLDGADKPGNILINVAGFIPLGFCYCAYWARRRSMRAAAWRAIALGVAVTFTIEILQALLPTRQSGVTDLFTNTLGTCIGAALYCWRSARILFERTLVTLFPRVR